MISLDTVTENRIAQEESVEVVKRLCEHFGIAFSANRVLPSLSDISKTDAAFTDVDLLNFVGKQFGLRFREMRGTYQELILSVSDSGPVVVRQREGSDQFVPILEVKGSNRVLISQGGIDQKQSSRWLKRQLKPDENRKYRWLLVQPVLAAENASRLHYQGGQSESPLTPLQRFTALLKPEASDVRTVLIFSVVIGLLSLTLPLAVEAVVNTIAFGRYLQPLFVLSFIVLVFLGFRAGLSVLMNIVTEIIQRKLFVRTVEDLSYRLTRVPLSVWRTKHGPELVNRFFDIVTVQKVTSKLLLDSLMLGLQTIIGLSVLAFYHPFLLGYDIGLLVMMTVILYFIGRGGIQTANAESQLKYETAAWLQEIVRHPSTYKFNGGLGFAINRADELAAQYIQNRQKHYRILIRQFTFAMMMQVIAATVLLALGGYLVIEGQMTLGQLVAAELIVAVILGSFAKLGKDLESFYDLMASVNKLGKLFDLPFEQTNKLYLVRQPGAYKLSLVDYQLDSESPKASDLTFEAGKNFAVYGSSELQRNRFIETLTGQCKPKNGYVLLDEYRVDSLAAESLQNKVSLIRDIELFEGTVDENIRMGRHSVGSADANEIVTRLGLQKVIATLPDGFGTRLSISGYPLSQGQAIRLVVARALIARPAVLFIDGLFDRLSDEATEDLLPRLAAFSDQTTIIIATGRREIARWADSCLNIGDQNWALADFTD
ncbi:MAG: ABC transporter transmembrane domain-containing protein [Planctomycetota bacterium]